MNRYFGRKECKKLKKAALDKELKVDSLQGTLLELKNINVDLQEKVVTLNIQQTEDQKRFERVKQLVVTQAEWETNKQAEIERERRKLVLQEIKIRKENTELQRKVKELQAALLNTSNQDQGKEEYKCPISALEKENIQNSQDEFNGLLQDQLKLQNVELQELAADLKVQIKTKGQTLDEQTSELIATNLAKETLEYQLQHFAVREEKNETERREWEQRSKCFEKEITERDARCVELEKQMHLKEIQICKLSTQKTDLENKIQDLKKDTGLRKALERRRETKNLEKKCKETGAKMANLEKVRQEEQISLQQAIEKVKEEHLESSKENMSQRQQLEGHIKALQLKLESLQEKNDKVNHDYEGLQIKNENLHHHRMVQSKKLENQENMLIPMKAERESLKMQYKIQKKKFQELQTSVLNFAQDTTPLCEVQLDDCIQMPFESNGPEFEDISDQDDVPNIVLTDRLIDLITKHIPATAFKPLGTELGFCHSQLTHYEANNQNSIENAIRAMLIGWKAKQDKATTKQLYTHIKNMGEKIDRVDIREVIIEYMQ